MISRADLQRVLRRDDGEGPLLSVFLDMSVNSDNKRTYDLFLAKQRSRFADKAGARNHHLASRVGAALDRVQAWIDDAFDEANRGAAVYVGLESERLDALQFPVSIENAVVVAEAPRVRPLVKLLSLYAHHGVILVDREHLRMLSLFMGRPLREQQVETRPYPAPHDIRSGGYSARDFQRRKAEEVKHFFKEFAREVSEFDRLHAPDDFIVLGTDENVKQFLDFLPQSIRDRVIHTEHASIDDASAAVVERLEPHLRAREAARGTDTVLELRDRVDHDHFATAGFADTLVQLQEGKVATLVVGEPLERSGARCSKCGFYLADDAAARCPYCGGETHDGVDLVETMIRMAAEQDVEVAFAAAPALTGLDGVGALLRF